MKIALDAMGGDHAPKEIILGALDALQKYDFLDKIYLVGQRDKIEAELTQQNALQNARLEIVEASEVDVYKRQPYSSVPGGSYGSTGTQTVCNTVPPGSYA